MKAGLLTISILLLLAACKSKDTVPRNILSQSKMKAVLWDIVRSDVFIRDYWMRQDSVLDLPTESSKIYQQVFKLHDITKEEFQKSFDYYHKHPALLKFVLDSITSHANDPLTEKIKTNAKADSLHPSVRPVPLGDDTAFIRMQKQKRKIVTPKKATK